MKSKKITIAIFIFIILLVLNTPLVCWIIDVTITPNHYRYSNYNGTFTAQNDISLRSSTVHGINTRFKAFIEETNPPDGDKVLYRIFWRNPIYFWRWYSYLTDEWYDLPYMSWKEIRARRGYDKKAQNTWGNWQRF